MEDHVFTIQRGGVPEKEESGIGKKVIVILGILIFSSLIAAFAYFLGKNSGSSEKDYSQVSIQTRSLSSTPTNSITPTPQVATISATLSPTPIAKSKTLFSVPGLDGFITSSGSINSTLEVRAGRNTALVTRGFITFDLNEIPSVAKLEEATLRIYQTKLIGNPYAQGGNLKIDHLTFGDALDNSDYGMAALVSNIATLSTNNKIEWKETSVLDAIKDDLANVRSKSQFRIHFTSENTGGETSGDFSYFDSGNNYPGNSGNKPELVIKYH